MSMIVSQHKKDYLENGEFQKSTASIFLSWYEEKVPHYSTALI